MSHGSCPKCGAPHGFPCVRPNGELREPHEARERANGSPPKASAALRAHARQLAASASAGIPAEVLAFPHPPTAESWAQTIALRDRVLAMVTPRDVQMAQASSGHHLDVPESHPIVQLACGLTSSGKARPRRDLMAALEHDDMHERDPRYMFAWNAVVEASDLCSRNGLRANPRKKKGAAAPVQAPAQVPAVQTQAPVAPAAPATKAKRQPAAPVQRERMAGRIVRSMPTRDDLMFFLAGRCSKVDGSLNKIGQDMAFTFKVAPTLAALADAIWTQRDRLQLINNPMLRYSDKATAMYFVAGKYGKTTDIKALTKAGLEFAESINAVKPYTVATLTDRLWELRDDPMLLVSSGAAAEERKNGMSATPMLVEALETMKAGLAECQAQGRDCSDLERRYRMLQGTVGHAAAVMRDNPLPADHPLAKYNRLTAEQKRAYRGLGSREEKQQYLADNARGNGNGYR